jgi:magnesium chelatase family protein
VHRARELQRARFAVLPIHTNKEMSVKHIDALCPINRESEQLLKQAVQRMGLSARSYHRTIKVARTISDLDGENDIQTKHIAEALQFRQTLCE